MNQDRDFNSEMGPTYTCSNCRCKFKAKFQDSELCISCNGNLFEEIQLRLEKHFEDTDNKIKEFGKAYKKLHNKK